MKSAAATPTLPSPLQGEGFNPSPCEGGGQGWGSVLDLRECLLGDCLACGVRPEKGTQDRSRVENDRRGLGITTRDGQQIGRLKVLGPHEAAGPGAVRLLLSHQELMLWRGRDRRQVPGLHANQAPPIGMAKQLSHAVTIAGVGVDLQVPGWKSNALRRARPAPLVEAVDRDGALWSADSRSRREAVGAMKIASEHPEGERFGAGQEMEEGFLLGGVALEGAHVAPGHAQDAVLVEADFADAAFAGADQATVAAGITAHRAVGEPFVELPFHRQSVELIGKCAHRSRAL